LTGKFRCDGAENKREKIQLKEILHYDAILLTFCVIVGYYIYLENLDINGRLILK